MPEQRGNEGTRVAGSPDPSARDALQGIIGHGRPGEQIQRGICLLNAGQYDEAVEAYAQAIKAGAPPARLPTPRAPMVPEPDTARTPGQGPHAGQAGPADKAGPGCSAAGASGETHEPSVIIRHVLRLVDAGDHAGAEAELRSAIADDSNSAALHYHLGTLLAATERFDEAELRFTQAISIERDHVDALVGLALCAGARGRADDALPFLQRAQALRPGDARTGLLLAQAARTARNEGRSVRLQPAAVAQDVFMDDQALDDLVRRIEFDPDVLDAFTTLAQHRLDERTAETLLEAVRRIVADTPGLPEFHFHAGRLLTRLRRTDEAIAAFERAVELDPGFVRALIELGGLLLEDGRSTQAVNRLEQAVNAGGNYADVLYQLGNAYKKEGSIVQARAVYRQALDINGRFQAAQKALAELAD